MKLNNVTFCEIFNNSGPCYIWFFNTANREHYMMGTTYYISVHYRIIGFIVLFIIIIGFIAVTILNNDIRDRDVEN